MRPLRKAPRQVDRLIWYSRSDVGLGRSAGGVYFYQVRAGSFSLRHRMTLVR